MSQTKRFAITQCDPLVNEVEQSFFACMAEICSLSQKNCPITVNMMGYEKYIENERLESSICIVQKNA